MSVPGKRGRHGGRDPSQPIVNLAAYGWEKRHQETVTRLEAEETVPKSEVLSTEDITAVFMDGFRTGCKAAADLRQRLAALRAELDAIEAEYRAYTGAA